MTKEQRELTRAVSSSGSSGRRQAERNRAVFLPERLPHRDQRTEERRAGADFPRSRRTCRTVDTEDSLQAAGIISVPADDRDAAGGRNRLRNAGANGASFQVHDWGLTSRLALEMRSVRGSPGGRISNRESMACGSGVTSGIPLEMFETLRPTVQADHGTADTHARTVLDRRDFRAVGPVHVRGHVSAEHIGVSTFRSVGTGALPPSRRQLSDQRAVSSTLAKVWDAREHGSGYRGPSAFPRS